MSQKAFIAPVWVMASTGLLTVLSTLFNLYGLGGQVSSVRYEGMARVFIFLWPALFFAEAWVYWIIRKRMTRKALARVHIVLTFFSSVILRWVLYVRIVMHAGITLTNTVILLYGLCMIVGHVFFITVITEAWLRKKPSSDNEDKNVHLLDDFINK